MDSWSPASASNCPTVLTMPRGHRLNQRALGRHQEKNVVPRLEACFEVCIYYEGLRTENIALQFNL